MFAIGVTVVTRVAQKDLPAGSSSIVCATDNGEGFEFPYQVEDSAYGYSVEELQLVG